MEPWLDQLSSWMKKKEGVALDEEDLGKSWNLATEETDSLLETANALKDAYTQVKGKYGKS